MLTRIMQWMTMAALLTVAALSSSAASLQLQQLLLGLAILPFAASLAALKTQQLMSMASITVPNSGSESL